MRHDVIAEIRSLGFYFVKLLFLRKVCAKMISFGMYSNYWLYSKYLYNAYQVCKFRIKEMKALLHFK